MGKTLELVGGPPASGKSTYVRATYGNRSCRDFVHLDYDAMVVKEVARTHGEVREQDIRDYVSMIYGRERAAVMYGVAARVTVDWPFCISKRAEEYMSIGRMAGRYIECNFFTAQATEAWKRALTRHVGGEYNAFTVFLIKNSILPKPYGRPSKYSWRHTVTCRVLWKGFFLKLMQLIFGIIMKETQRR